MIKIKSNTYFAIISEKPKKYIITTILIIILIITIILIYNLKIYSSKQYYGIYNEGYISINIDIANSDTINKGKYIKINNIKYSYSITNISPILVDEVNNINYQNYKININKPFEENEIVKIDFFYNKQRIIKKLLDLFI